MQKSCLPIFTRLKAAKKLSPKKLIGSSFDVNSREFPTCYKIQCREKSTHFTISRVPPKPGKPPCLPPAKTLRYEVEASEWMDPSDVKELLWRRQLYNHALHSIRAHFKRELAAEKGKEGSVNQLIQDEKDEFEEILRYNDEENQISAQKRLEAEGVKLEEMKKDISKEVEIYLQEEEASTSTKRAEVQKIIEEEKNYVTAENLEERILSALDSPEDFNYAIDREGNKYVSGKTPNKYLTSTHGMKQAFIYEESADLQPIEELEFLSPPPSTLFDFEIELDKNKEDNKEMEKQNKTETN